MQHLGCLRFKAQGDEVQFAAFRNTELEACAYCVEMRSSMRCAKPPQQVPTSLAASLKHILARLENKIHNRLIIRIIRIQIGSCIKQRDEDSSLKYLMSHHEVPEHSPHPSNAQPGPQWPSRSWPRGQHCSTKRLALSFGSSAPHVDGIFPKAAGTSDPFQGTGVCQAERLG